MIKEEDLLRELEVLEKKIIYMKRPDKAEVLRAIAEFKIALAQPERFEMPKFLRRI